MRSYSSCTPFKMNVRVFDIFLFLLAFCNANDERFERFHEIYENELRSQLDFNLRKRDAPIGRGLEKRLVPYTDGNQTFTGYVAYDSQSSSKRPVVLVVHDWNGRDEFENGKAEALARLGYVGFALDLYGRTGANPEENRNLMKQYRDDRPLLLKRLQLAINETKKIDAVDSNKIGAIGFCFGGMGVLDMARGGLDLKGVVSFHGSLNPPPTQSDAPVKAKVLVLHGHDDPGTPPVTVQAFEQEMTKRKADWQVHVYSNTVHAFTVPTANSSSAAYNALSDKRSWLTMKNFFQEVFA